MFFILRVDKIVESCMVCVMKQFQKKLDISQKLFKWLFESPEKAFLEISEIGLFVL